MKTFSDQSGFTKVLILVIAIIIVFSVLYYIKKPAAPESGTSMQSKQVSPTKKAKVPKEKNLADLPLSEKTNRAEKYLAGLESDLNAFFRMMDGKNPSVQELQRHMQDYNNIITGYTNKINALQLMCPVSAKMKSSSQYKRYGSWCKEFQQKDSKVMNSANERIQKILQEAGFTRS